jgi:Fur family transcriptional regulator, peroxide stress response regulator
LETNITYRYSYKALKAKLLEFNLKATQQRIVIYEALLRIKNHPAAETIYEEIKLNNPSISLGTVYKTLDTFVSVGLAVKVMS